MAAVAQRLCRHLVGTLYPLDPSASISLRYYQRFSYNHISILYTFKFLHITLFSMQVHVDRLVLSVLHLPYSLPLSIGCWNSGDGETTEKTHASTVRLPKRPPTVGVGTIRTTIGARTLASRHNVRTN